MGGSGERERTRKRERFASLALGGWAPVDTVWVSASKA